ncbi:MAG: autotransporter-associated beta strand repeat-containing protein [Thermoguttaceae bacterium]
MAAAQRQAVNTIIQGTAAVSGGDLIIGAAKELVFIGPGNVTAGSVVQNNASGASALTIADSGTVTLTGANSYSGGTTVAAGMLLVAGSLGGTAVTVGEGATLGGTGSIGGTVVVLGGSTAGTQGAINLADGMIGTLMFSDPSAADTVLTLGGLTVGSPSAFTFEVGAVADRIQVTAGKVAVNPGGSLINITALSGFGPGTYDLLDFPTNQASGLGYLSLATTSLNGYALSLRSTRTSEQLVVAVPEPSALALLGAGALGLLAYARRRRRAA